jgi:hypothetical protein
MKKLSGCGYPCEDNKVSCMHDAHRYMAGERCECSGVHLDVWLQAPRAMQCSAAAGISDTH